MTVIFRHKGCRFFFFSNEGDPPEPMHVHVRCAEKLAKIWMEPSISVAEAYGFSAPELNELVKIATTNRRRIAEAWHEHLGN